jgi:hypothetical protein
MRASVPALIALVLLIGAAALFAPESSDPELRPAPCVPLDADSSRSPYVLPYAQGTRHWVNQANCSGHGHARFWNHGYDFKMDIGTPVLAARDGTVATANDGCKDGDRACTNLITVRHADGSFALYSHVTRGGVGALPGLGLQGYCPSQPVNFRNTEPNPHGLKAAHVYSAG